MLALLERAKGATAELSCRSRERPSLHGVSTHLAGFQACIGIFKGVFLQPIAEVNAGTCDDLRSHSAPYVAPLQRKDQALVLSAAGTAGHPLKQQQHLRNGHDKNSWNTTGVQDDMAPTLLNFEEFDEEANLPTFPGRLSSTLAGYNSGRWHICTPEPAYAHGIPLSGKYKHSLAVSCLSPSIAFTAE